MSKFKSDTKAQGVTSVLIIIMIAVVIGMVCIAAISPIISQTTEAQKITNETFNSGEFNDWSYDEANATGGSGWIPLANDDILPASETVQNITSPYTVFKRDTDYLIKNATGQINVTAAGSMLNNTDYHVSYQYWHDSYIASSTTRSIVKLLPLMVALAIFMAVAAVGLKVVA